MLPSPLLSIQPRTLIVTVDDETLSSSLSSSSSTVLEDDDSEMKREMELVKEERNAAQLREKKLKEELKAMQRSQESMEEEIQKQHAQMQEKSSLNAAERAKMLAKVKPHSQAAQKRQTVGGKVNNCFNRFLLVSHCWTNKSLLYQCRKHYRFPTTIIVHQGVPKRCVSGPMALLLVPYTSLSLFLVLVRKSQGTTKVRSCS